MTVWTYAILSVIAVSLISLVGALTVPMSREKLRNVISVLVALAAGAMLSNAVTHLIPHALEHAESEVFTSGLVLAGFLFCFLLERVLNVRCHHGGGCHGTQMCARGDGHDHHEPGHHHIAPQGWMSLLGHTMDNFIDGVLIGTTYLVSIPAGIATTIAVILHEVPMELGNYGVLVQSGFSRKRALAINFASAMISVAATAATLWLGSAIEEFAEMMMPVAAGIILYITCSSLIPQMQREKSSKRASLQFLVMIMGMAVMVAVHALEAH